MTQDMGASAPADRAVVNGATSGVSALRASVPSVPSERELHAWLTDNCGRGIPFNDATDLASALHGLSYVLRQIESTTSYKVHIGQCNSATTALRWALGYLAAQAMSAREGQDRNGLGAKPASAVAESDAPQRQSEM